MSRGWTPGDSHRHPTSRLEPVTKQLAAAVLAGDVAGIAVGAGSPHADTCDAMAMALSPHAGPSWVVSLDDVVIGDCGGFS